MNFLLHRHMAEQDLSGRVEGAVAGLGAMLPDLWRMAHRRVRPRPGVEPPAGASSELQALLAGVQHHLRADDVFHRHPVFTEGERKLAGRFRGAEIQADKIGLFAHIGWELCLDGALLRRVGVEPTLDRLRTGLGDAGGELAAVVGKHVSEVPEDFHDRLDGILQQVAWSDWVPGYTHGEGVARRLAGVRRRVGLPAFTTADLSRLGGVFDAALDDAGPALETLLSDWCRISGIYFRDDCRNPESSATGASTLRI